MIKNLTEKIKDIVKVSEDEFTIELPNGYEVNGYVFSDDTADLIISKDGDYILSHIGLALNDVVKEVSYIA